MGNVDSCLLFVFYRRTDAENLAKSFPLNAEGAPESINKLLLVGSIIGGLFILSALIALLFAVKFPFR